MEAILKNKLIANYWSNKLKLCPIVNDSLLVLLETEEIVIENEELSYFNQLTGNNEAVAFTVLLSIYTTLLKRYFETVHFIASSGLTKNKKTVLLKAISIQEKTFKQCLAEVKAELQEVFNYSKIDESSINKESFYKYTSFGFSYNENSQTKKNDFPFYLTINKNEKGLNFHISYDKSFTTAYVANHFLKNIKNWLENLESYIPEQVEKLSIIDELEKEKLLYSFNNTKVEYPNDETLINLFEKQAENTPNTIAIVFEDKQLTYKNLNAQANQLAHYLKEVYTINPNDLIGIKLERTEQLVITILGILKSGAAYVPIDINYPEKRINYIEKDSNCKVVIDEEKLANFRYVKDTYSIENPKNRTKSSDLAYVIYTSGTTGKPKGVMIMHQNALAMLHWARNEFNAEKFDVVYAVTSHCFDLSIYELFYPLSLGKKIKLLANSLVIGEELQKDKKVLINTVPSSIRSLIESGISMDNATIINLAGEPFPLDIAKKLLTTNATIRNLYGPSEDTTYSTGYKLSKEQNYTSSIPIGRPITNTQAYVLDENLALVPIGVIGKLYLAGAGIAKGYLNRPDLTNEKFIKCPFDIGKLMYDTGDLVRWTPSGILEFFGRKDHQVKLRGYRIELGEIENEILEFSQDIQGAVADVKIVNTIETLIGYYVSEKEIDASFLRTFLETKLPRYMVPMHLLKIDSIPLTPNGKVNRDLLTNPTVNTVLKKSFVAARSEDEKQLVQIWEEVLGIENIGIKDHFFELGGHSLMIAQIINKMSKQMGKNIRYKAFHTHPTIEEISKTLETQKFSEIQKVNESTSYPVTSSQNRMWLLSQLDNGTSAYKIAGSVEIKGEFDIEIFSLAYKKVIERHEVLRSYFKVNDSGELRQQYVSIDNADFDISVRDISNTEMKEQLLDEIIEKEMGFQYKLDVAPLIKGTLIKVEAEVTIFFVSMHHIISDGWSLEIFTSEVLTNYIALQETGEIEVQELPLQFKDYTNWLRETYKTAPYAAAETYWLEQFKENVPVLELPSFKKRPTIKTYSGKTIQHQYSEEFVSGLKKLSKKHQVTLFMTLMSGIKALLSRYSNQDDITVGTPIAGRTHPDLENQIGLYLNTLAIRTKFDVDETFISLLQKEKQVLLDAYTHQTYPFDRLIEKLNLKRDTSRSPLFDIMIVLQNQQQLTTIATDFSKLNAEIQSRTIESNAAQFDIAFTFVESDGLCLEMQYNTDVFEEKFIQNIGVHLENIFKQVLIDPSIELQKIELITADEKETLTKVFNNTDVAINTEENCIHLFQNQVASDPEKTAIHFKGKKLTYLEVDLLSNQLANYLIQKFAVGNGDIIAIQLERSEWLVISILAILKTGAAYVPIDGDYPESRVQFIKKDAAVTCIIDESFLVEYKENDQVSNIQPEVAINGDDIAYVIYTSGSTGMPKGVLIAHKSLLNLCFWHQKTYNVTAESNATLFSGIAFDASVWELFPYLISGATLYPIQNEELRLDVVQLTSFFKTNQITHAYLPSRICQEIIEQEITGVTTIILTGGESLSYTKKTDIQVYNNYGPTENTVVTTYYDCKNKTSDIIPIGKPIHNTKIYILSKKNALQPIGVVGELCISGIGLAQGYLNRPEATALSFIAHPFVEGKRLYKTGDVARWLPDGNLEFVGRKDHQVKIRGYRIELGEIEHEIVNYTSKIHQAIVTTKEINGEKTIVAYYTATEAIATSDLRSYLMAQLPSYMIPGYFMEIASIPFTENGKIAYKKLPAITEEAFSKIIYTAPESGIEEAIASIWKEMLSQEIIGIHDDFFELGGHSLLLTKLRNAYHKKFNVLLQLKDLYKETTLKEHEVLITENKQISSYEAIETITEQDFYDISPTQMRYWLIQKIQGKSKEFNIYDTLQLPENLTIELFTDAFNEIVKRHEALRTEYLEIEGIPKQRIKPYNVVNIPYFESVADAKEAVFNYEFDLENAPLYRVALAKQGTGYLFFFNIHHSICDGWSMSVISRELMTLYVAKKNNVLPQLSTLTIQYKDYVAWQAKEMQSTAFQDHKAYWKGQLLAPLSYLQLPTDYSTNLKATTTKSAYHSITIPKNTKHAIEQLAKRNAVSVFSVLMAAFKIVLFRLTGEKDCSVGIPAANRNHDQLKDVVGSFLNTVMHRNEITPETSVADFLKDVNTTLLEGLEHQNYPFEKVLEDSNIASNQHSFPVSPVFLNLLDFDASTLAKITDFEPKAGTIDAAPKFDLEYYIKSFENGYTLKSVYNAERFKSETIAYWLAAYVSVLDYITTHTAIAVQDVPVFENYISENKTETPQNEFSYFEKTEIQQSIAKRFEAQVEKFSSKIAVQSKTNSLTYFELNNSANNVAHKIINTKSTSKRIGLLLPHNETCIIGMLGALKAGYTYVPIDVNNPTNRIAYILDDAGCKMLIHDKNTREKALKIQNEIENIELIAIDQDTENKNIPNPNVQPSNEAYVLYTSGSTGLPKGVVQTQKNVLHYIRVYTNSVHLASEDKLSVFSTYTFDASVKDIYGAILNGASVHIYNIMEDGLHQLSSWLTKNKISIIHMVPTIYRHFIRQLDSNEIIETVRIIDLGGEACYKSDIDLFKKHFPKKAFIVNDYGPTEATIVSQNFISHHSEITKNNVSLGKAVTETEVFILDEENNKKGVYEVGEITFMSEYLSLGYLNREEQTAAVFIENFRETGKRIYKSGDIGRLLPSGEIEFLQRKDTQVKINGLRVELSEIEYQLEQIEVIQEAIVAIKKIEDINYLTAYIKSDQNIETEKIKSALTARIPTYMIPRIYIALEKFPLTRTGKIDRKSLPNPVVTDIKTQAYVAPQNDIEAQIVEIWSTVLQQEKENIGVLDNFFELGGNSLHAVVVVNKINKTFNTVFSIQDLYESLIIKELAALVHFFIVQQNDDTEEDSDEIIL